MHFSRQAHFLGVEIEALAKRGAQAFGARLRVDQARRQHGRGLVGVADAIAAAVAVLAEDLREVEVGDRGIEDGESGAGRAPAHTDSRCAAQGSGSRRITEPRQLAFEGHRRIQAEYRYLRVPAFWCADGLPGQSCNWVACRPIFGVTLKHFGLQRQATTGGRG
jgi:hypothetical protein